MFYHAEMSFVGLGLLSEIRKIDPRTFFHHNCHDAGLEVACNRHMIGSHPFQIDG